MVIHQNWSSKIHSPQKKSPQTPKNKAKLFSWWPSPTFRQLLKLEGVRIHDKVKPLFLEESTTNPCVSFSQKKKAQKNTPHPPRSPWLALVTRRIFWVPQTRRTHLSERSGSYPKLVGCGNYHRLDVIVCENSSQKKNHPSWSIMSCVENSKLWSIWGGFPKVVAGKLSDLQIKFWKHPKW